ncbi:MAG: hypothetical protein ACAI25_13100, partial [Planctomycetota bacterium]
MALFGSKVDRSKELRAQRLKRFDEPPAELSPRRLMTALSSLSAAGTIAASALLGALLVAANHWMALGGARGAAVLTAGSLLLAGFLALAARAFAPHVLGSASEAARAGGL